MKRPRVFVTGSLWSLLIYLVISEEEDIKRTKYFFLDKGIHSTVRRNFEHVLLYGNADAKLHWRVVRFLNIFNPLYKRIKYPYLCYADIYGIDQGWEIQSIIGRRPYTLIEDGIIDYKVDRNISLSCKDRVLQMVFTKIYQHDIGRNSQCRHIVLSQPFAPDSQLAEKGKYYNLEELWCNSSESKQKLILQKFNLTQKDVELMSQKPVILLTQPFSEDKMMPENDKIQMYRQMMEAYGEENVLIKPHPRETTDYSEHFPQCMIMDKVVPFQLFSLIGIKFNTVSTVCSTAALSLQSTGTIIDFKGSKYDDRVYAAYGDINVDSYK